MTTRFLSSLIATVFLCASLTGCGETPTAVTSASEEANSDTGSVTASDADYQKMQNALVGVWLGIPQLDQARLKEKLTTMDADAKTRLLTFVENFKTTVMAIEYCGDGKVFTEIQVNVDNKPVFEASEGNWKVVAASQNRVSVNTVENLPDGKLSQSKSDYTLYENNNVMVTTVPTHPELADLNPQIVFTRENLDSGTVTAKGNQRQNSQPVR